jgi:hypothetical protein
MAASSISFELIMRVREFYTMAYQEILSIQQKQIMTGNGITDYAIPSYIISVAAVEAFINELFFAIGPELLKGSHFGFLSQNELQKLRKSNLGDKLINIPEMAFDQKVFTRGRQPFQDMNYLINVRDSFVHYKMGFEAEHRGAFDYLVKKGIALKPSKDAINFWVTDISTFEGIRWAHNTAMKIMSDIINTAIKTNRHAILISMGTQTKYFFNQIPSPDKELELWTTWLITHTKWKKLSSPIPQKTG